MIHAAGLFHITGIFLLILAGAMALPAAYGWAAGAGGAAELGQAALVTAAAGAGLATLARPPKHELSRREGLLLTVMLWIFGCGFGAVPYLLTPAFASVTDAVFESVSGFTTTGATILPRVEVLPPVIQFWRHFTHWLGGMGVVLLTIAVLPLIGAGGMALYRAEFSGARSEKLAPRIAETAKALWRVYAGLSLAEYVLLRLAGMSAFDAACHTFSTLGTGGFSTRSESVGAFVSPLIQYIIIFFMLLAGLNFTQHYRLWVRREAGKFFRDYEVRAYLAILGCASAAVLAMIIRDGTMSGEPALRAALFQVVSIGTTTGFATVDYEKWHPLPHAILLALMFVGGCTGSTAGGWKVARVVLLGKIVRRELLRTSFPRGVFAVRAGGETIPENAVQGLLNLIYLSLFVFLAAMLTVAATGVDLLTSLSSVAAAMFSIGPGFGSVGPAENYAHLPAAAKWTLSFCMVAGRLEFYTFIVVLTPGFWRK
ncbi:MAG: TrkH family potassium uptake protein [Bryobacteraceae bacterium]